jgi:putative ABC transport system ATP-binding protein
MADGRSVVLIRGVSKNYGSGFNQIKALRGVSFEVGRGEFVSIMGQSGSGKSTLLHVLALLHKPTAGSYLLAGRAVEQLNDRELSRLRGSSVGMVFQRFNLLPADTILTNVQLPLVYMRVQPSVRHRKAKAVLAAMGLADRSGHLPSQLSGGQLQRAAIARALVTDPQIVLADEPTGNLDSESGLAVMGIFRALHRLGRTVIQVTHDREMALYADRILHIKDGLLAGEESVENPTQGNLTGVDLSYLEAQ